MNDRLARIAPEEAEASLRIAVGEQVWNGMLRVLQDAGLLKPGRVASWRHQSDRTRAALDEEVVEQVLQRVRRKPDTTVGERGYAS